MANVTHLYDEKYVTTFDRQEIQEITCKMDGDEKPPGNATSGVKELYTRDDEEDNFVRKEPPADNKALAKYVNERTMPPLKELPAEERGDDQARVLPQ